MPSLLTLSAEAVVSFEGEALRLETTWEQKGVGLEPAQVMTLCRPGHVREWEGWETASAPERSELSVASHAQPVAAEPCGPATTAVASPDEPVDLRQAKEALQEEVRQQSKGKGKGRRRPDKQTAAKPDPQQQRDSMLAAKHAALEEVQQANAGKGRDTAYRKYDARAFYTKRPPGIERDDWGA